MIVVVHCGRYDLIIIRTSPNRSIDSHFKQWTSSRSILEVLLAFGVNVHPLWCGHGAQNRQELLAICLRRKWDFKSRRGPRAFGLRRDTASSERHAGPE